MACNSFWTLMHYGRPADADLFADDFADHFAEFAGAAARVDWNDAGHWHNNGLSEMTVDPLQPDYLQRKLNAGYARRLRRAQ